ncbi:VRK3 isoform 5 [Pongo abelii]|uniref:VRK3 isoform 5 n=1 Tax=Pongo abelii TaxID=9601 RepID=A0A2J8U8Q7_PONAB|nr:VRK3 isoform 5 [Pongo abelii]
MISFCPDCGKSIQAAFKFCPYCGNSLPIEEHAGSQTFVNPHVLSFQGAGSRPPTPKSSPQKTSKSPQVTRGSPQKTSCSPQKTRQSPQKTSCSPQKTSRSPQVTRGSPQKTSCSPQKTRQSPQTLKRSRMTTSLEALPTGTVLTDKSGRQWKLKSLQTRDNQGILYEAAPTSALACDSGPQKQKFSLKLVLGVTQPGEEPSVSPGCQSKACAVREVCAAGGLPAAGCPGVPP